MATQSLRQLPDPISAGSHHLELCYQNTLISKATGFTYYQEGKTYLITNWHNVTGRHPDSGRCLDEVNSQVPDSVRFNLNKIKNPGEFEQVEVPLYIENEEGVPVPQWFEHPEHAERVDVVAIPLNNILIQNFLFRPINRNDFEERFLERVGDDVFVIGFPFSHHLPYELPIWKRGSIASEPVIDFDGLPKILIDTATRPGLSGSPVITQNSGVHTEVPGRLSLNSMIGTIRNFLGVYSGRIGEGEENAQLGIVWKKRVIPEIISGGRVGQGQI